MTRRVSKKHNHSTVDGRLSAFFARGAADVRALRSFARIKIKAKVRARGTRSQHWYPESRVQILRKKCRTQSLWNLLLAGDWHFNSETMPLGSKPHMMRVMLIR